MSNADNPGYVEPTPEELDAFELELRQWCPACGYRGDNCVCWMKDPIYEPGYQI